MAKGIYTSQFTGTEIDARLAEINSLKAALQSVIESLSDTYTKEQVDIMVESILAAINATPGVTVTVLPAASADTMGRVYYVGPVDDEYERYITSFDGGTYYWVPLGSTAIQLENYAQKDVVDALAETVEAVDDTLDMGQTGSESIDVTPETWTRGYYSGSLNDPIVSPTGNFYSALFPLEGVIAILVTGKQRASNYRIFDASGAEILKSGGAYFADATNGRFVPPAEAATFQVVWNSTYEGSGSAIHVNKEVGAYGSRRVQAVELNKYDAVWDSMGGLTWTDKTGIDSATGKPATNNKTIACKNIQRVADFADGGKIRLEYRGTSTNVIAVAVSFFNASMTFLGRFGFAVVNEVPIPAGAVYCYFGLGLGTAEGEDIGGTQTDYDLANFFIRRADLGVRENNYYFEPLSKWLFRDGRTLSTSNGAISSNSDTIATVDYRKVDDYLVDGRIRFIYKGTGSNHHRRAVAFYDKDKVFISPRGDYAVNDGVVPPPGAVYFRMGLGLRTAADANIGGHACDYDLPNHYVGRSVLSGVSEVSPFVYTGEEIKLPGRRFSVELAFGLDSTYAVPQGGASFDKYLFVFHDGNATAEIYDLTDGTLLQSVTMPNPSADYHCNTASFGTLRAEASDEFPLLYVGMEKASVHTIMVYRVVRSDEVWTITKVQEIIAPVPSSSTMYYPNVLIDQAANKFYLVGLGNYPYSEGDTNIIRYARFAMPPFGEDVVLDWDEKEAFFQFSRRRTGQGDVIVDGKIYQLTGLTTDAELVVIDIATESIVSIINFHQGSLGNREPEFIAYYDGCLYVGFLTREVLKFTF